MSPKVIAILQARTDSIRLPGKIHLKIGDFSVLELISHRLRNLHVEEKWLATTDLNSDDYLVNQGRKLGWSIYRGSPTNVLSRFQAIISSSSPDYVVRLTGDNPLVDSESINFIITNYLKFKNLVVYVSDFNERAYPIGSFPEFFNSSFFEKINFSINSSQTYHYSHVTSWMRENAPNVRLEMGNQYPPTNGLRWTLDTELDYSFFKALNNSTRNNLVNLNYLQLINHLKNHPEIVAINKDVIQKDTKLG